MIDALAWTLLHFLWQGALIGVTAFLLLRLARPERASTRYALGVATLGVMLITCLATFTILSRQTASPDRDAAPITIAGAMSQSIAPVRDTVNDVTTHGDGPSIGRTAPAAFAAWRPAPLGPTASFVLVLTWGIGVLALSLRLLGGWMLTRSLTRHAISSVSPAISAAAASIAERLQLRQAVAIVESGAVAVPTLVGWIKPVVLLPAAALSGLSPEQLQAILAHELAHVRRHDYLVNLLQSMVETLLFYHPAMWWVSAQVRAEREHCCDDLAVDVCGDRLVYATALAELTTITSHRAFALAATDGSLLGRVQRILGRPGATHEPAPAWAILALFVLVVGGVGSFRSASAETATVDTATVAAVTAKPLEEAAPNANAVVPTASPAPATSQPDTKPAGVLQSPREAVAFFSTQWFRNWFDSSPPPAPPPLPAPTRAERAASTASLRRIPGTAT